MHDGAAMVKGSDTGFRRDPDEIAAIMDLRARRAIDHFTGLAWGKTPRLCPICGYRGMFSPVRHKPEIWCPSCDSRPRHRLLHYTDPTHLRFYGRDLRDRIAAAGFQVTEFAAVEPDVSAHALHRGERIFVGVKPKED